MGNSNNSDTAAKVPTLFIPDTTAKVPTSSIPDTAAKVPTPSIPDTTAKVPTPSIPEGLFLNGVIKSRGRKKCGAEGKSLMVSYTVLVDGKEYNVSDFPPEGEYYACGESVSIPLEVSVYNKEVQYRVRRKGQSSFESF
ncbi:hypothetical protein FACS1894188_01210 [Clostridia bacterium]|nr:hypothetical protein FACS1894188_01210 [Clostridia bacterium]